MCGEGMIQILLSQIRSRSNSQSGRRVEFFPYSKLIWHDFWCKSLRHSWTCSSRPHTYLTRKLTAPSNWIIFFSDSCLMETVMAWKIYRLSNTFPGFFCFFNILGQVFCSWGQNWHFFKHLYFRFSLTVLLYSGGILSFQQTLNSPFFLWKSQRARVSSTCLFMLWARPGNSWIYRSGTLKGPT